MQIKLNLHIYHHVHNKQSTSLPMHPKLSTYYTATTMCTEAAQHTTSRTSTTSTFTSTFTTSTPPALHQHVLLTVGARDFRALRFGPRDVFTSTLIVSAQSEKEATLSNMEGDQGSMALTQELPTVFHTFEEVEEVLRDRISAGNPTGFVLKVKITEEMLMSLPPNSKEPCQSCDIKHANLPKQYHPHSLTPYIWSALPQDLTELVLSKLPVKHVIALTRSTTLSANFRKSCARSHPDLFALMRWDTTPVASDTIRATVYDISCNEWTGFDLTGFPASNRHSRTKTDHGYEDSMYSHDKGLVCFAPPSPAPLLVSNPLTGEWRKLPLLSHEHKLPLIVEILVEDMGSYKVKVVCGDTNLKKLEVCMAVTPGNSAYCYDSRTGRWTSLETGFVFGGCGSLQQFQPKVPVVFDCKKRVIFYMKYHVPLRQPYSWAGVRDSIVVLHDACSVSEFAWRGRYSMQSTMTLGPYVYKAKPPHLVFLFASDKFLLVVGDSIVKVLGKNCQLLQVYDRVKRKWHLASDMGVLENSHPHCLKKAFTCELRWNAVP